MSLLRKVKKTAAMVCITALLSTQFAYGAPTSGQVVAGDAVISGITNMIVDLTAGKGAIINWQSFDIASNEKVTFNFAASGGAVLNRVTGGGGASTLAGTLTTNGNNGMVYIINPQGVTWSSSNVINGTTSNIPYLTLSSLNVTDQQFINFMNNGSGRLSFANTNLDGVHPSLITGDSYAAGPIKVTRSMIDINGSPPSNQNGIALLGGSVDIGNASYSIKLASRRSLTIVAGTSVTVDGQDYSSWSDYKSGADNTVQIGLDNQNYRVLLQGPQLNILGNSIAVTAGQGDETDETRLETSTTTGWLIQNPDGSYASNHIRLVAANEANQTTGNIDDRIFTMSATAANTISLDRTQLKMLGKRDDFIAKNQISLYGGNISINSAIPLAAGGVKPVVTNNNSSTTNNGDVYLGMVAANEVKADGTITTANNNNINIVTGELNTKDTFLVGNAVTLNGQLTAQSVDKTSGLAVIIAGDTVRFSENGTGITSGLYQAGAGNRINIGATGGITAKNTELRANSIENAGKIKVSTDGTANLYAFKSMDEYSTDPNKATVIVDNASSINSTGTVENAGTVFALGNTVNIAGADTKTDILAVGSATSGNLANTGLAVTADASETDAINPFDRVVIDKTAKTAVVTSSTWALSKANTALADATAAASRTETAKTAAEQAAAAAEAAAANAAAAKAAATQAAQDAAAAATSGSVTEAAAAAAAAAKAAIDADAAKAQAATAQAAAEQAAANAANEATAARAAATLAAQMAAKAPADKADAANAAASQAAAKATAAETAAASSLVAKAAAKTAADNAAADAATAASQALIAKTEAAKVGVTEESLQAAADAAQAAVNAAAAQAAATQAAAEAAAAAAAAASAQAAAEQAAADAAYALADCDVSKAAAAKAAAAAAKTAAEQAAAEAVTKAAAAQAAADQAALEAAAAQAADAKTPIPQAAADAAAAAQSSAAAAAASANAAAAKATAEQAAAAAANAAAKAAADADATLPPVERSRQLSSQPAVQGKSDQVAATQPKPQFPPEHANSTGAPSESDDAVTVPEG